LPSEASIAKKITSAGLDVGEHAAAGNAGVRIEESVGHREQQGEPHRVRVRSMSCGPVGRPPVTPTYRCAVFGA